jgi:hypothetical protein
MRKIILGGVLVFLFVRATRAKKDPNAIAPLPKLCGSVGFDLDVYDPFAPKIGALDLVYFYKDKQIIDAAHCTLAAYNAEKYDTPGLTNLQVENIGKLVTEFRKSGDGDTHKLIYILATAMVESQMGKFMTEFSSGSQYENRSDLGNTQPGDGPFFKGRGFSGLTGRLNYTYYTAYLGIDLVKTPTLAADPDIAKKIIIHAMINGIFTTKKLNDYINKQEVDYYNARRTVNALDKAATLEKLAKDIEAALLSLTPSVGKILL